MVLDLFYFQIESLSMGMKWVFKHQDYVIRSNFHPLEVVGRGSERQRQVGGIFKKII